ncbi:hypothetical protein [Enterococcus gallinarum]|uniref:hypothetical protein n=1 Tax=Enterococcus gallinarum TaxID=1353 RepID=UPI0012E28F3A|nr:hypothetical protein [Enterococcus gallinarum]MUN91288.1 hypothetical protein [Enterococcus gallinarum]
MITANLKKNLNTALKHMITHIVLNSEVQLETYQVELVDSMLLIEFEIPESIATLRKIEFYEEKTLLSECAIFVPVAGNILFKYRVEVE